MADCVRTLLLAILARNGNEPMGITNLEAEYKELEGKFIPAKDLGYANTQALLQDMQKVKVFERNGRVLVKAIDTVETRHVVELINAQKKNPAKQTPWTIPRSVEDNIMAIIAISPNEHLLLSQLMNQYTHFYQTRLPAPRGHTLGWLTTATKFVVTNDTGKSHVLQPMHDVDMVPYRAMGERLRALVGSRALRRPTQTTQAPTDSRASLQRQKNKSIQSVRSTKPNMTGIAKAADASVASQTLSNVTNDQDTLSAGQAKPPQGSVSHLLHTRVADAPQTPANQPAPVDVSQHADPPSQHSQSSVTQSSLVKPARLNVNKSTIANPIPTTAVEPTTQARKPSAAVVVPWPASPPSIHRVDGSGDSPKSRAASSVLVNTVRRQLVDAITSNQRNSRRKLDSPVEATQSDLDSSDSSASRSNTPPTIPPASKLSSGYVGAAPIEDATAEMKASLTSFDRSESVSPTSTVAFGLHGSRPAVPQWIVDKAIRSKPASSPKTATEDGDVSRLSRQLGEFTLTRGFESAKAEIHTPSVNAIPSYKETVQVNSTLADAVSLEKTNIVVQSSPKTADRIDQAVGQLPNQTDSIADVESCGSLTDHLADPIVPCNGEPVEEVLGLPLDRLLNLMSFLREHPPITQTFLPDLYWATYTEELTTRDRLNELVDSLMRYKILVTGPASSISATVNVDPETVFFLSGSTPCYDGPMRSEQLDGKVEGSDNLGFKLMPIRNHLDASDLQPVNGLVVPDQSYLCVKNNHQDIVVAMKQVSDRTIDGCYWQVRSEAGAHRIVHERALFKLDGSGIDASARSLSVWPAGRRPANGETVSVKVLKHLPNGTAVCHFIGEKLFSRYVLRDPPSRYLGGLCVFRWGGLSYVLETSVNDLHLKTEAYIPVRCLKYAEVLVDFLKRHGISADSNVVNLFDVVEYYAQRGVAKELILDMVRL